MKYWMNRVFILICVAGISGLMSCIKVIDLESLRPDPTLVVNSVAVVGEPLEVSVSRTWFFTDDHPNVALRDAEVKLFVNGTFKEMLRFQEGDEAFNTKGYFVSDFTPVAGDRIQLEALHPELGEARAETVVPDPAPIVKANMTIVNGGFSVYDTNGSAIFQVTIKDDPSRNNYYLLRLEEGIPIFDGIEKKYTGAYEWEPVSPNYATEPVFGQSLTALDQILGNDWISGYEGRAFSDELFNGEEYTLRITEERYSERVYVAQDSMWIGQFDEADYRPIPHRLRVYLHSISEDYYRYLKVLQDKETDSVSNTLIDGGLAEPIRVFSNIEGGVGILGSCHLGLFETDIESASHSDPETAGSDNREY